MIILQWAKREQEEFFFETFPDSQYESALKEFQEIIKYWEAVRIVLEDDDHLLVKDWVVVKSNYWR